MKAQFIVRLWFFIIGVNDEPLREIEGIFIIFELPKVQFSSSADAIECQNTWNSVIESSFALMKFMKVLMNQTCHPLSSRNSELLSKKSPRSWDLEIFRFTH